MLIIKKLSFLLTERHKKRSILLIFMTLVMALLDMVGVASILPFLTVLTNPEIIETNFIIKNLYDFSKTFGIENEKDFFFFLGVLVFLLLIFTILFRALTTYAQIRFAHFCEFSISKKLAKAYISQPYSWFFRKHSADLGKNVLSEVGQVMGTGIKPLINLVSQSIVAISLVFLLILVNPKVALIAGFTIFSIYLLIYVCIRIFLDNIGKERVKANQLRFNNLSEAFGAIKEIKVRSLENFFINRFAISSEMYARSSSFVSTISHLPRFALEGVAFGGMLLIVLFLINTSGDFIRAIPIIALYAFAGYRLMPAIQTIYASVAQLRFISPAIDNLYNDLKSLQAYQIKKDPTMLQFNKKIELKNIYYRYPDVKNLTLEDINIEIPKGSSVGLIGSTGSGKTTTVDIILSLIEPQKGTIEVDGVVINKNNSQHWQNLIGYVPQHIYLADDSIKANIAFGLSLGEIDEKAVEDAAKISNLHSFITNELPEKYDTRVGERGIRLSGGQRQRIGIARAIYHKPKIIILDEATSALDNLTEKEVMKAILNLQKEKVTTIIIAHRLSTLEECDNIFFIDKGKLKKQKNFPI